MRNGSGYWIAYKILSEKTFRAVRIGWCELAHTFGCSFCQECLWQGTCVYDLDY